MRPDIDNGSVTCPENGRFSYANLTIPGQQYGSSDAAYVDFRVGVEWDIAADHMLYAKVSSGHKAGGFNDKFDALPIPEVFAPEALMAYELGSRKLMALFANAATLNATLFYYDYDEQVLQDLFCLNVDRDSGECNSFSLVNRNLGESQLYGLEIGNRHAAAG